MEQLEIFDATKLDTILYPRVRVGFVDGFLSVECRIIGSNPRFHYYT
jgi:hypothetical protein